MIGREINGFKIIDSLGSGAFGHTYKVQKGSEIYAMKILKPEAMSSEILSEGYKRFQREIRSLQKVQSDYVVEYYESGVWVDKAIDHYFIVMEFVEGMDFAQFLKLHRKTFIKDENMMQGILSQILQGLYDIHNLNIIHRDLKPANIYITDEDKVKLLDFGLVKMLDYSTVTTKGKIVGTPLFMSPEMIEGKTIDYRSDLYSFGVVLYFIFTQEYPFQGENVFVLLNNIVKQQPARISDKFPGISNALENIILKLLEKQPYLRPFKDALELRQVMLDVPLLQADIPLYTIKDKSFSQKKYFIRLLHTEKNELKRFLNSGGIVDGIEYPANYLPQYKNQISDIKTSNIPFFFDPSTNRLAYSKFSETQGLVNLPYVYDRYNRITPRHLSSIKDIQKYVSDVLTWQLKWETDILVSPFHYSQNLSDEWLSVDLKLIEECFEFKEKHGIKKELFSGVCIDIEDLTDEENRLELINRYSKKLPDGFIFYVNNIHEKTTNIAQLYAYIDMLIKFKKLKRPLIAARVGTLGLGLVELGVDSFSSGIASLSSFSEQTLLSDRQLGYDMERKYYIKDLLLTLKAGLTSEILQRFPEYRCSCKFCQNEYQLDKINKNAKAHFLQVRSDEMKMINDNRNKPFVYLAKSAKSSLDKIKKKGILLPPYNHIDSWIDVFSEFAR
ncbi:MAG: serine/threonine protein kinase [Nitrospirae bacterium]|nr:serine/threonine protein kinase [Nitrospirota bacterium]